MTSRQLTPCTSSPTFGIRPSSLLYQAADRHASSPKSTFEEVVDLPDFCASMHQDLVFADALDQLFGNVRFIDDFADHLFRAGLPALPAP